MPRAAPAANLADDDGDAMSLHTVFCAECTTYFDWKSLGVFYTHRVSGMPGKITRLLACSDAQLAVYPERGMKMGPTFVHKNYIDDPTRCDPVSKYCDPSSGSYNKPAAVMHWSQEAQIAEEYVLYVDADMLLRAPLDPIELGAKRGRVVSEHVGYLDVGIRNGLVDNFVPGGEAARAWARAAGWYHIFHIDDLRTLAPDWLRYCRQMRTNPQLYWNINGSIPKNIPTGDAYVKYGEAPWISEMYGYVFSAAEHQIDTKLLRGLVEYTDSGSSEPWPAGPAIIHYGLHCHVGSYHFTKYDYGDFDVNSCPRVFFRPPNAPKRHEKLCAETINTLNDALCDFYGAMCPPPPEGAPPLRCPPHEQPGETCANIDEDCEAKARSGGCNTPAVRSNCLQTCSKCCGDAHPRCLGWALNGECTKNPGFMASACKLACNQCPAAGGGGAADARRIAASPPPPAAAATTASPRTAATASDTLSAYKAHKRATRAAQERRRKRPTKRRRQRASPRRRRPRTSRPSTRRPPRRGRARGGGSRGRARRRRRREIACVCVAAGGERGAALLPKLILVWAALSFGLALFVYRHFRRRRLKLWRRPVYLGQFS